MPIDHVGSKRKFGGGAQAESTPDTWQFDKSWQQGKTQNSANRRVNPGGDASFGILKTTKKPQKHFCGLPNAPSQLWMRRVPKNEKFGFGACGHVQSSITEGARRVDNYLPPPRDSVVRYADWYAENVEPHELHKHRIREVDEPNHPMYAIKKRAEGTKQTLVGDMRIQYAKDDKVNAVKVWNGVKKRREKGEAKLISNESAIFRDSGNAREAQKPEGKMMSGGAHVYSLPREYWPFFVFKPETSQEEGLGFSPETQEGDGTGTTSGTTSGTTADMEAFQNASRNKSQPRGAAGGLRRGRNVCGGARKGMTRFGEAQTGSLGVGGCLGRFVGRTRGRSINPGGEEGGDNFGGGTASSSNNKGGTAGGTNSSTTSYALSMSDILPGAYGKPSGLQSDYSAFEKECSEQDYQDQRAAARHRARKEAAAKKEAAKKGAGGGPPGPSSDNNNNNSPDATSSDNNNNNNNSCSSNLEESSGSGEKSSGKKKESLWNTVRTKSRAAAQGLGAGNKQTFRSGKGNKSSEVFRFLRDFPDLGGNPFVCEGGVREGRKVNEVARDTLWGKDGGCKCSNMTEAGTESGHRVRHATRKHLQSSSAGATKGSAGLRQFKENYA